LKEVFRRLEKAGFTLNRNKVHLAQSEIKFSGHSLSAQGVKVLPERVEVIQQFPTPKNLKAVRRFLGMAGFYARFVQDFSLLAEPLHALKRKNAKFVWGESQQTAFDKLKAALSTPPVLQIPDFSKEFVLVCDSSDVAISAVLHQRRDDNLASIAYASRLLYPAERKYSFYEKKYLAVVYGCERYRAYLEHKEFTLHTDNQALSWVLRHVKELGRICRWVLRLTAFKFKVYHIPGKANVVADCLTRQYDEVPSNAKFSGLILQHLPAAFQSIREHQLKDPYCNELRQKIVASDPTVRHFKLHNDTFPFQSKREVIVVPESLKPMTFEYFHDPTLGAHLRMTKTLFAFRMSFIG
jgi:hypothetical protein